MSQIAELINTAQQQGIQFSVNGDKLRVKLPKGTLNPELKNQLSTHKADIIAWLQNAQTTVDTLNEHRFPLSYGQQALWFVYQEAPDSAAYNMVFALRIAGEVNHTQLECSLQQIVQRHSQLRTVFELDVNGQVWQQVTDNLPSLKQINAYQHTWEQLQKQIYHFTQQPFDLTQSGLRAALFQHTDETQVLVFVLHHLLGDARSMGIVQNEWLALYTAAMMGSTADLPPLTQSYAHYVHEEIQFLNSPSGQQLAEYWHQQLAGEIPILDLPTDYPRPKTQTINGKAYQFALDSQLSAQLRTFAQNHKVSLFTLLLAAFHVLLHRYSGQTDIWVGSPTSAGRLNSAFNPLVGYFVNPVVLRGQFNGETFTQFLNQLNEQVISALAHQAYPFPLIVKKLQRDSSRVALFQVMFALNTKTLHTPNQAETVLTYTSIGVQQMESQFDLSLIIGESENLSCIFNYNADLFAVNTIERMAAHLKNILNAIVESPSQTVQQLPILTESEIQQFQAWNGTATNYSQDQTIVDLFEQQVETTPDNIAIVFNGESLTYQQLNAKANQLAHHLIQFKQQTTLPSNPLIAIAVERSLEMVIGLLGILKAGGAYVPIDPTYPVARIEYMLTDSAAPILLTQNALKVQLPLAQDCEVICLDTMVLDLRASANPTIKRHINELAYVIYTSGSTGKPKGVCVPHQAVVRLVRNTNYVQLDSAQIFLQYAPISFDAATLEIWGALLNSAKLVVMPAQQTDIASLAHILQQENISILWLTNSLFKLLLEEHPESLTNVTQVLTGGEVLSVDHINKAIQLLPNTQLINGYGPTENTTFTCCYPIKQQNYIHSIPIGKPIANTQVFIVDNRCQPVPIGIMGELVTSGTGLAHGYLNRPELTAEKFIEVEIFGKTDRIYKTGDLARWLPDGNIEFLGRLDHQVKLRGFRIELGEIETVLSQHEAVKESTVIVQQTEKSKNLVAYITLRQTIETSELRDWLKTQLPDYMVPTHFQILDTLPLMPNGKLDRQTLEKQAMDAPIDTVGYIAPRNSREELLANIWANILGLESVGIHDNFFELGGHSLLATQIISRIRTALEIELPLRELFNAPTIALLSTKLMEAQQYQHRPPLVPQSRPTQLPLSFAQERLWFLDQLTPDNPFYNTPLALRLTGQLNQTALQHSLNALVERHETLRTVFSNDAGKAYVTILPIADNIIITYIDLTIHSHDLKQQVSDAAHQPFDLAQETPLRVTLFKLQNDEHILLLTFHHIAVDGWSLGVFTQDFSALYNAFAQHLPNPLTPLPIQYIDFSLWQRNWFAGETLEQQQQFWLDKLAQVPTVLELPTDYPRPAVHTYRGAMVSHQFSTELTQQLKKLSQQQGTTLFMTLLAAFAIVIQRYSGQDQFIIGSPIANRHHQALESLIGFFVNTLALPLDLDAQPTFTSLLQQIRRTTLDAYTHQDLPFERLVDILNLERDMSRNPLTQVMFALQNAPLAAMDLTDLRLEPFDFGVQAVRMDLEVHLWEHDGALDCVVLYYQDIFAPATIERMLIHFEKVLTTVVVDAEQAIHHYQLLSEAEIQQLKMWNETATDYPADRTIVHLFEEQVGKTPDNVAVVFEDKSLTYQQLNAKASQLAYHLLQLKQQAMLPDNPLIAIAVERSLEMVIGLLGILKAGGAYVPIDPTYPTARIEHMLNDCAAPILLTQSALKAQLPLTQDCEVICLDEIAFDSQPIANPNIKLTAHDLAYIIYTSGSTGQPKGTCVPHQAVVRLVKNTGYAQLDASQIFLQYAPISFDAATLEIWGALLNSAKLILMPTQQKELAALAQVLQQENISILWLTNSLFNVLLEAHPESLAGVKQVLTGGEALSVTHINKAIQLLPNTQLINGYGPTENTTFTCCYLIKRQAYTHAIPIGKPIANTKVFIVDNHYQPVPIGVIGELVTSGAGLACGYLNHSELTAEKFIEVEIFGKTEQIYKTGDLARWLPDGNIEFLGRLDSQVKLRGFRIELGEIEAVLSQHPTVAESVVICIDTPDRAENKRLIAYVIPHLDVDSAEDSALLAESNQAFISQWEQLYNDTYGQVTHDTDLSFNITGWNSSYTGAAIPAEEMQVWTDTTVTAIRHLQPQSVLEIGCGTGLLLARIAPHTQTYWGFDFSSSVIQQVEQLKRNMPELAHVVLKTRTADNFEGVQAQQFDTIILNSVIQYFPSVGYLINVLEQAIATIKPGGHLFVGDVRHLPLLHTFHASVQLFQADDDLSQSDLSQRVAQQQLTDKELVIDPRLFIALYQQHPRVTGLKIRPHRGTAHNELTRFRYQAILEIEHPTSARIEVDWQTWQPDFTLEKLHQELAKQPAILGIRNIANLRLTSETAIIAWLDNSEAIEQTVGELRQTLATTTFNGLDPDALWQLGAELGYQVDLSWQTATTEGHYDVLFSRDAAIAQRIRFPMPNITLKQWHAYANNPLQGQLRDKLIPQLRDILKDKLPDYMLPSQFVVLDKLPLTPNGKIDRKALPALAINNVLATTQPVTSTEKLLANIWTEVLGIEQIGIHNNFFDLGGHSLQAVKLVSKIASATQIKLSVKELFLSPTIAQLAAILEKSAVQSKQTEKNAYSFPQVTTMSQSSTYIQLERRSLLSQVVTKKIQSVDAAVLGYLSDAMLAETNLTRKQIREQWYENMPVAQYIKETAWGRIAVLILPRFSSELYDDMNDIVSVTLDALEIAGQMGANTVSLAGILPSATEYGHAVIKSMTQRSLPQITTGHATTCAAVILSIQRILQESGREIVKERVGFIGVGSIGLSSLHLMLSALPHPVELILCDLYSRKAFLEEIRNQLVNEFKFKGQIQLLFSKETLPEQIYNATLIIGATNVPDVVDINQIQSGTLIVDDSGPHCFNSELAIKRFEAHKDILFTEGGVLKSPHSITQTLYVPYHIEKDHPMDLSEVTSQYNPFEITGCVFSSVLSASQNLPTTIGLVQLEDSIKHIETLRMMGFQAANLHCENYVLPLDFISDFRKRFGDSL